MSEPGVKYHCDACSANITHTVRIKCGECEDFDLCGLCFCKGEQVRDHKRYHSYRVIEQHAYPIFDTDWGADEELLLIEGAEIYGLGNWQDMADHIGTRTKEECEKHYMDVYVASQSYPIPNMHLKFDIDQETFQARKKRRLEDMRVRIKDLPPPKQKPLQSQPSNHEVQGFMPGRLEFETEFDNEAEQVVKDMEFAEDDEPGEKQLKLMILDIYNSRLDRRAEHKRLILERGLTNYRQNQANDKKRPADERDLLKKLRVYARLQTADDYDTFTQSMALEMNLRKRIAELQEWRSNGITTLAGGEKYEREKAARQNALRLAGRGSDSLLASRLGHRKGDDSPLFSPTISLKNPILSGGINGAASAAAASRESTPKLVANGGGRKPAMPLDLTDATDLHLLTPAEVHLCSQLRIMPRPYLWIKEQLVQEYMRLGSLKRREARQLIKIDVNKSSRIYDFMVSNGWIKNGANAEKESKKESKA